MFQTPVTQQIIGLVDDGLDPKRTAVLEVLLDPGVLEERIDGEPDDVTGDDLGLVGLLHHRWSTTAGPVAAEDEFHVLGAPDVEVVDHEGLEEPAGVPWGVEDDSHPASAPPHRLPS